MCDKIMIPSFDAETQPLPPWLTDRTLLQLCVRGSGFGVLS